MAVLPPLPHAQFCWEPPNETTYLASLRGYGATGSTTGETSSARATTNRHYVLRACIRSRV